MNVDPRNGPIVIEIPVIDRLPVLPYWPVYADWTWHLESCAHCLAVMDPAEGSELVSDLCPDGYAYQTSLHWDIATMRAVAALN